MCIIKNTYSVNETVEYEGEIEFDSGKPDGTPRKLLDVSKLKELGWTYKTDLAEGIRLTHASFLGSSMRTCR